jgi:hypothetical protein
MIGRFPQVVAILKRYSAAAAVDGRFDPGAATETPITIVAPQPSPGVDTKQLPEGERQFAHFWTVTAAVVQKNDHIEVGGTDYKVNLVQDYKTGASGWSFGGGYQVMMRESQ